MEAFTRETMNVAMEGDGLEIRLEEAGEMTVALFRLPGGTDMRPLLQGLELTPSEFCQRQVRVSLFPYEDAGWLIDQAGSQMFMFASDYPHPEGGRDPIGRFDATLDAAGTPEPAREHFYYKNFASLLGIAV